jgi:hypothetical protein
LPLADLLRPLFLQLLNLACDHLPARELAEQPLTHPCQYARAVPLPEFLQAPGEILIHRHLEAQPGEQPLDAVDVGGSLALQRDQLAV